MGKFTLKYLIFLAGILMSVLPAKSENFTVDGIKYGTLNASECEVLGFDGSNATASLTLPVQISYGSTKYDVVAIGNYAFQSVKTLKSVTIPANIKSVGYCAFEYCENITEITLCDGIQTIDGYAFSQCQPTSITVPSSVTSIGTSAFNCPTLETLIFEDGNRAISFSSNGTNGINFSSLTYLYYGRPLLAEGNNFRPGGALNLKTITLGKAVKLIPDSYATGCKALTEINFSGNVTSIGKYAFQKCEALPKVVIPDACTSIGYCAFEYCYALSEISIGSGVSNIDGYAFSECQPTSITVPSSVTSIGTSAFNCSTLETLIFEDGNNAISYSSNGTNGINFSSLTYLYYGRPLLAEGNNFHPGGALNLKTITLGKAVKLIPDSYADGCKALTEINFSGNETSIGKYAFRNCQSLPKVVIPDACTSIGYCAFEYCYALSEISIGSGVSNIDGYAFSECSATTLFVPGKVEYIGSAAFNIATLKSLIFEDGKTPIKFSSNGWNGCNFNSLNGIYYGRPFDANGNNINVSGAKNLTEIALGEAVTFIPDSYASGCERLYTISFSGNETSIGKYAFQNCSNLRTVTIPDKVQTLGYCAFSGATSLWKVILPVSLQSINSYAFEYCDKLTEIYSNNPVPPTVAAKNAFATEAYNNAVLKVPDASISAYQNADVWKDFFHIAHAQSLATDDAGIYVIGGQLKVDSASPVNIYTTSGKMVYYGNDTLISLPSKGIYLVKINNKVVKVLIP